jgi:hypothetical protein
MLLSQSTRVTTELAAKHRSVADAIVGRLTIDEVNTQLQQAVLLLATNYEISWQGDITPLPRRPVPDKSNSGALIDGVVGGVVGVALILGGLAYAFQRRSTLVKASWKYQRDGGVSAMKANPTTETTKHSVACDNSFAQWQHANSNGFCCRAVEPSMTLTHSMTYRDF